jgi:hypothetical protein
MQESEVAGTATVLGALRRARLGGGLGTRIIQAMAAVKLGGRIEIDQ